MPNASRRPGLPARSNGSDRGSVRAPEGRRYSWRRQPSFQRGRPTRQTASGMELGLRPFWPPARAHGVTQLDLRGRVARAAGCLTSWKRPSMADLRSCASSCLSSGVLLARKSALLMGMSLPMASIGRLAIRYAYSTGTPPLLRCALYDVSQRSLQEAGQGISNGVDGEVMVKLSSLKDTLKPCLTPASG